jgi:hypothetical protein
MSRATDSLAVSRDAPAWRRSAVSQVPHPRAGGTGAKQGASASTGSSLECTAAAARNSVRRQAGSARDSRGPPLARVHLGIRTSTDCRLLTELVICMQERASAGGIPLRPGGIDHQESRCRIKLLPPPHGGQ